MLDAAMLESVPLDLELAKVTRQRLEYSLDYRLGTRLLEIVNMGANHPL